MSQPGFFDDMASGMEFFLDGTIEQSSFQPYEEYGDLGTPHYGETPPKSPLFTPAPSREGSPSPESLHTALEGIDSSELRQESEEEHPRNNTEPSSEKPSENSQKLDSERQCGSEANNTNEESAPKTSDPEQEQDNLYSDYRNLFGEDNSDENELPESDERQLSGEINTNDEQPVPATSEDKAEEIDFDDLGSLFGGYSSNTPEKNADKITDDDIENDPLFGGFDDSGLGTEDDSSEAASDTGNCKSIKNKSLAPAPVATALEPFRLHLPEPPRANASNQGLHLPDRPDTNTSTQWLHLPDHPSASVTKEATNKDFEADSAREMRKDSNGPRLHLPSIPSAAIQQAAVNACVQQQNNLGQEESNAPSKFPNAESDRRQGGTDASAKMSRSQTRACARAGEPITKLSGPPPSLFQPLDSDSSPEEGKSSQRRKTSHFTWAFADHVDFGKPGPGNKYQKPNSAQDPVLVGDDLTVEKTNEEVNSQSQDVDRPVTEVPCVIDLTNGDEDELPAENEKDNWIDEIDGQNHSEDLGDGQRLAQDYQSFLTPRQNKLAPTNNPIQQIPPVQPVSQYHPQIPVNAQSLAPQNGIPHQSQLQEGSVVDAPSGHTYPPNTNHPNSGRQFSHINGNFSSSPSNYSSPYGQDIQQTPEVEPFQSSYPELKNNLPFFNPNDEFLQFLAFEEDYGLQHLPMDQAASLPHHDQAASFPHHGHLNQTNEKHDDGFSDGESDSEEGSSAGRTGNIQKNGRNAKTSPRKYKPRPRETRAEYGYHRPWMSYEEYKYLFPLAEPRLCFENAIAQQMEEDKALIAKGEAIPPRIPITRHIKISHERLDALNQLRLSKGDEPFKPKLSGVKDPFAFLDAKRRRIEEEQEGLPGHENQEMRPNAKRPRLAPAPIQTAAPMNGNPMMVQQDPYAMEKRQRHYLAYRVPKLREKCKALKLSTLGLKGVLIQRLVDHEANSRPAVTNNIQQSNRGQSGWVVRHDQPMPDVGPINGMHARPVGMNYGQQQHQGQVGRVVRQDQPSHYANPGHGMRPSTNYRQNPSTMLSALPTEHREPDTGPIIYGNGNQQPWNGGHFGSSNNHYTPPAHGTSARQQSMNAGLGGYGTSQQPMNGGSNRYTHGSLQQPYSAGYQGNTRVRPQYSAQRFAGGYMPSLPEGSMHNPPQGIYGTSMRQRPSDNGNGHVNRAMGMTSNHMSRMNSNQNNINQTISNWLDSDAMNWQADMQIDLGDMNWNDSTQPF